MKVEPFLRRFGSASCCILFSLRSLEKSQKGQNRQLRKLKPAEAGLSSWLYQNDLQLIYGPLEIKSWKITIPHTDLKLSIQLHHYRKYRSSAEFFFKKKLFAAKSKSAMFIQFDGQKRDEFACFFAIVEHACYSNLLRMLLLTIKGGS